MFDGNASCSSPQFTFACLRIARPTMAKRLLGCGPEHPTSGKKIFDIFSDCHSLLRRNRQDLNLGYSMDLSVSCSEPLERKPPRPRSNGRAQKFTLSFVTPPPPPNFPTSLPPPEHTHTTSSSSPTLSNRDTSQVRVQTIRCWSAVGSSAANSKSLHWPVGVREREARSRSSLTASLRESAVSSTVAGCLACV